jgi:hypothetical protein
MKDVRLIITEVTNCHVCPYSFWGGHLKYGGEELRCKKIINIEGDPYPIVPDNEVHKLCPLPRKEGNHEL